MTDKHDALVKRLRLAGNPACWDAADRIEALEAALVPFAEEAAFALHRPPGPGYLKHEDWQRVRELADE